jgi:hypothetical protein
MDGSAGPRSAFGGQAPASGSSIDHSDSWTGCGDLCLTQFGAPTDIPVTGDWDGDGTMEVGTFRQAPGSG